MLGLRWKDIDFDNGKISIRQVMSHDAKELCSGAKTAAGNRTIDLSDKTVDKLLEHKKLIEREKENNKAVYKDKDLVFCTPLGTPVNPSNIRNRIMNPLIEKAGVTKIRFHDLRHTHANILLLAGAPVKAVSERLGHSNIKITLETYSHVLPTTQKEIANQLDSLLS
ncbi:site-specific integrase [Bacillus nakamurai]|uniref:site-specific integrase n=1 Tax=Bacillus nakamurai TaxID=1793963 RepID=UPI001E37AA2C|nr:site-specific integrase [Bacillus nakamurai]MCP6682859.1 site-specific integrase [Bacillus nakamurai]MED1226175.1 site-specific integrase [Bacillus nakamurai]